MRSFFYHNSPEIYHRPSYYQLSNRARGKRYKNRALGLFASTQRTELDYYGDQQYQFQLAMNSTVIEVDFKVLERCASWDYYFGLRRGWMMAGIDAVKARKDPADPDWLLVVLNFAAIEHWDRMRWENAFYQGMPPKQRQGLLQKALEGDLAALTDAFCCRLAPMGSRFWIGQYEALDEGKALSAAAIIGLQHALQISNELQDLDQ